MRVLIRLRRLSFFNGNKSYNFKPNLNLPTHYTPILRNHENFSYRGGAQQGPRPVQNFFNSMLHKGSKDSSSKGVREKKIQDKGDLNLLKIKC